MLWKIEDNMDNNLHNCTICIFKHDQNWVIHDITLHKFTGRHNNSYDKNNNDNNKKIRLSRDFISLSAILSLCNIYKSLIRADVW